MVLARLLIKVCRTHCWPQGQNVGLSLVILTLISAKVSVRSAVVQFGLQFSRLSFSFVCV